MKTDDQIARFEEFWRRFSTQIEVGDGVGGYRPEHRRLYTTIVARLPDNVAREVIDAVQSVRDRFPDHYYYPQPSLHFTLLDISDLFHDIPDRTTVPPVAHRTLALLGSILSKEEPLTLQARGLGVFPTTVFVELLDVADRITALRAHVTDAVRRVAGIDVPAPVTPGLAFANVVRFGVKPEREIVEYVGSVRGVLNTCFVTSSFEVVSTDKALSDEATVIHGRLALDGQGLSRPSERI